MTTGATPPPPVRRAVLLMWVGAALSVIGAAVSAWSWDDVRAAMMDAARTEGLGPGATDVGIDVLSAVVVVVSVVSTALWVMCAVLNTRGRPWARVLTTVLMGLGALTAVWDLASGALDRLTPRPGAAAAEIPGQGIGTAVTVVDVLLAVTIVVLLWRPSNAPFYAAGSQPRG